MIEEIKVPYISVIIVSYNYGYLISRCLNACKTQTFTDFELIIVENGSTDDSMDKINQFCIENNDMNVKVIIVKDPDGLPKGRNAGLDAASGKYIMLHDADDWMNSDCLETLANEAINTNADKVIALENNVSTKGKVTTGTYFSNNPVKWFYTRSQATIYKRSVFINNNLRWRNVWQEDYFINLYYNNLARKVIFVQKRVYNFFVHQSHFVKSALSKSHKMKEIIDQSSEFTAEVIESVKSKQDKTLIEYHFIKLYYLILVSYSKGCRISEIVNNYETLRRIVAGYFPNYLNNRNIRLFSKNHDTKRGATLMYVLNFIEKTHLLGPVLIIYLWLMKSKKNIV